MRSVGGWMTAGEPVATLRDFLDARKHMSRWWGETRAGEGEGVPRAPT